MTLQTTNIITEFALDTLRGLSSHPKYLSSKYFYDERGSMIFQDIMRMPEYYLTDCELEILKSRKQEILKEFLGKDTQFELIELGAGDGLKTKILLSHFAKNSLDFRYTPIDISEGALKKLVADIRKDIPGIQVEGRAGDYFDMIGDYKDSDPVKKIVLFLGSNIGNFNKELSLDFLHRLKESLNPNDLLFIGFDLKKDPEVILRAYNDPHGYTSAFNLNLLQRINHELDANFDLGKFSHKEVYDPVSGTAKSYLISKMHQKVRIHELDLTISFDQGERLYTEMSQKYDLAMIKKLAEETGYSVVRNFFDKREYFVNSLWKLKH